MPLGKEVGLGPGHIVLDGDPVGIQSPTAAPPHFRPMPIVAKRSPISATAELLLLMSSTLLLTRQRSRMKIVWMYSLMKVLCLKKLRKLKPDKSQGPDEIHPMVLLRSADEVVKPLTILFKALYSAGVLPADWKCAKISPIFKKGGKSDDVNNCISHFCPVQDYGVNHQRCVGNSY